VGYFEFRSCGSSGPEASSPQEAAANERAEAKQARSEEEQRRWFVSIANVL
jgi:hypothetical protein